MSLSSGFFKDGAAVIIMLPIKLIRLPSGLNISPNIQVVANNKKSLAIVSALLFSSRKISIKFFSSVIIFKHDSNAIVKQNKDVAKKQTIAIGCQISEQVSAAILIKKSSLNVKFLKKIL